MFGGEVDYSESDDVTLDVAEPKPLFPGALLETDDELIARSMLGRR
jgi:hypothetical protein